MYTILKLKVKMINKQTLVDGLRASSLGHLDVPVCVPVVAAFHRRLLSGQQARPSDLLLEHGEVLFQPDIRVQDPPLACPALDILAALDIANSVSHYEGTREWKM
jgi:hypothetical protein